MDFILVIFTFHTFSRLNDYKNVYSFSPSNGNDKLKYEIKILANDDNDKIQYFVCCTSDCIC